MLRRLFLMSPLPLLPVPAVFKGEPKEPREPRCSCEKRSGKDEGVPVVNVFPQVGQLNNDDLLIDNTTAETTLFSYAIPPGHLDGNHGIRVVVNAEKANSSGSDVTPTVRVKLGATTMASVVGAQSAGYANEVELRFELMAKNAPNSQELFLTPNGLISLGYYGTAAEDSTTALIVQVTVQMSGAHSGAAWLHRRSIVELL